MGKCLALGTAGESELTFGILTSHGAYQKQRKRKKKTEKEWNLENVFCRTNMKHFFEENSGNSAPHLSLLLCLDGNHKIKITGWPR